MAGIFPGQRPRASFRAPQGADTLYGGNGNDTLDGGQGTNDTLDGVDGTDSCDDGETNTTCETVTTIGDANNPGPTPAATVTVTEARSYDSDGQLIGVSVDDGTTVEATGFSWDNNRPIPQIITWSDTNTTNLLYGNTRTAATGPAGDETFAYNILGDATATPTGVLAAAETYGPFGGADDTGPDLAFGFRGELQLGEEIHLRARDLRTAFGRFLRPDPLDGLAGTATDTDPYHYANNDPVNLVDPLGLRPEDGTFDVSAASVEAACSGVGGKLVIWGDTGTRVCLEPPPVPAEGQDCWPPLTPGGKEIVWHNGSCSVKTVTVTCARGAFIPGANFVCQRRTGILQGLAAIAVIAGGVATGGALAVAVGGSAGIAIPTGGSALALAGGGTVAAGEAIVVSPTVAGALGGSIAGLEILVHMARDSTGKSGATDVPSWVRNGGYRPGPDETPAEAAWRVMDDHYGAGNWTRTGRWARELSQIAKWFTRHF